MTTFNRILCPTDFSRESQAALSMAVTLAQGQTSEVLVVYVEPNVSDMVVSGALPPHQAQDEFLETKSDLCTLIENCIPPHIPVRALVREGEVAEQLLDIAKEEEVNLIIMAPQTPHSTQEQGPCAPLSAIAQEILSGARCPVLLVHSHWPANTVSPTLTTNPLGANPHNSTSLTANTRLYDGAFYLCKERSHLNENQRQSGAPTL